MSWHYQIRKRTDHEGSHYDIVEVYSGGGHTEHGMSPYGMSREELINELERMLEDAKHYRTLVEKDDR